MTIDHFLILGAGASYGARIEGSGPPPPLGDHLAEYLREWLEANNPLALPSLRRTQMNNPYDTTTASMELWRNGFDGRLREFLDTARNRKEPRAFEIAANSLRETDPTLIGPLARLIGWSMLTGDKCAFDERPDLYDELFRLPRLRSNIGIISLNYDLLAEEALDRGHREFYRPGPRGSQTLSGMPVFKIHGSINWLRLFSTSVSSNLAAAQAGAASKPVATRSGPEKGLDTRQEYIPPGGRANLVAELKRGSNADQPILALYAEGKPVFSNYECIAAAFDACVTSINANPSASATIIGIRIPPPGDDPRLDAVLAALQSHRTVDYVAKGSEERAAAKAIGFTPVAETLAEFIRA
jgi:hypothetical protein